jgi:hypothetical protein
MTTSCLVAAGLLVWVLGANGECDSATGGELCGYDRLARCARFYEVVKDMVGYCFVERALVSIRGQIKLERFAFDTETVGHIIDIDPGKIRLACDWTNRSEIIGFKMNPVISTRCGIRKSLQPRFRRGGGQFRFASSEKSESTCAFYFCHGDIKFA